MLRACTRLQCRSFVSTTEHAINYNDQVLPSSRRSVESTKRNMKGSPQKLNMLAKQIRGLPVEEALIQMRFSPKLKSNQVTTVLKNAINLADINYEIDPCQLKITKAIVGKGMIKKRVRFMGRGQSGKTQHRHAHLTIQVTEVDKIVAKPYYPRYQTEKTDSKKSAV